MKALIILLFLRVTIASYSQEIPKGKIKIEKVPGVVIKKVQSNFSVYIPDNNLKQRVKTVK